MRVSVENTGKIGRRVTIAVPADEVEQKISERLKRLAKSAKLPGFRPGKAPIKVIEARYGGQVMQEVAGSLIEASLMDALGREGLNPAGGPDVEPTSIGRGKDLEYIATFDVYPKIEKLDISGVTIDTPECEVADQDVDATIETMRKQRTVWKSVDRGAQEGDRVIIDFTGTIDGEPFSGGQAEGYEVVLGAGQLLEEFEFGLRGTRVGGEKTISVKFPEDYQGGDVAGRSAEFAVTVVDVGEPELPEVNDQFAESFGVKEGGIAQLREDVKRNLQREVDQRIQARVRDQVLQALINANDMELPRKLVNAEIDRALETNRAALARRGVLAKSETEFDRGLFEGEAKRRVALGLILREIISQRELKPDKDRMRQQVETMAAGYDDPQAFIQWYYSDRQRVEQVEAMVLEDQVIEELLKTATAKSTRVTVDDFIRGREVGAESDAT